MYRFGVVGETHAHWVKANVRPRGSATRGKNKHACVVVLRRTGDDLHVSLHNRFAHLGIMIIIILRKLILIITLILKRLNPKDNLPPPPVFLSMLLQAYLDIVESRSTLVNKRCNGFRCNQQHTDMHQCVYHIFQKKHHYHHKSNLQNK